MPADARSVIAFLALLDHGVLPEDAGRVLGIDAADARSIQRRHNYLRPAWLEGRISRPLSGCRSKYRRFPI